MIYLDTSFVVPLFINEAATEQVERYVRNLAAGSLCVSHWTRLEFAGVLARDVRMEMLDEAEARRIAERLEVYLAASFELLAPRIEDYELARRYALQSPAGLRAGDALHLAIAANANVKSLLTLDQGMLKAGKLLKLPVSRGIR